jgi:phage shock protein PspC (stress-responsive transcriptional regulator)
MLLQTARFSRITTAAGLFAGAIGMLTGMALTPWEPEDSAASMIQTISAHGVQGEVAPLFLHYGLVCVSVSVLGLLTMVRHRAVVWGRATGLLAFVGLVNLSGMLLVDWFAIALGQSGLPTADAVGILERSATPINMVAWQIPGLIGVYLGLPLFLVALWRNGFIPWWPAVAVVAFVIASVILPPTLASSILGAVPYAAALSYVGWKTLSLDDTAWAEGAQPSPAEPTAQP